MIYLACCIIFSGFVRIWSIRYNQFHDQLLLTSSSDSRVILTNLASISSEPYGHLVDDDDDDDTDDDRDDSRDKYVALSPAVSLYQHDIRIVFYFV